MRAHALHVVTTGRQELADVLRVASGDEFRQSVDALHIREKHRTAREIWRWALELSDVLGPGRVIVNDRADAAAAAGTGGLHLAWHSLPPRPARRLMPKPALIGCSVHAEEEAVRAEREGADYVLFGHIFPTGSKPGLAPRGTNALAKVVAAVSIPVLAIGGIVPERVSAVLATSCAGIAVMSAVFVSDDPEAAVRRFREALDAHPDAPKRPWQRGGIAP